MIISTLKFSPSQIAGEEFNVVLISYIEHTDSQSQDGVNVIQTVILISH